MRKKKAILFAVLAATAAYGLLLMRFSLRNDQTSYFLPVRMYMSDAFNHHEFMLWNPFMSGSYPIHCDMQGSVWNPIVILFAWLFNYNSTLLSVELLLYILIGIVGCFYFARNFSRNPYSCAVIAVSYGCCGFAVSSLEFMDWEASFAFLPWVIHFFYLILKRRRLYESMWFSITLWLMLVCGYPSFFIYLGYILLSAIFAYSCIRLAQKRQNEIIGSIKFLLLGVFIFLILSLPAIHSFLEYLPHYARGKKAFDVQLNLETFSWHYMISLIFPGAAIASYHNNLYFGLAPFLILCSSINQDPSSGFRNRFLLTGCLFTFLFTLGSSTPLRMWCANYLPLLGTFGFSHSVRIFLILAFFIWLAPKLDVFFTNTDPHAIKKVRYASFLAGIILLVFLLADYRHTASKAAQFRFFYYGSAVWQLLLMAILSFSHKIYASRRSLFLFIAADLIASVWIVSPLTGLSRTPPSTYNAFAAQFYNSDTKKYLLSPASKTKGMLDINPRTEVNTVKLIPRRDFPSNTRLDTFYHYLADDGHYDKLLSLPIAFASNASVLKINDIELGYNFINADVTAPDSCQMVIQQTFYKRWKSAKPENILSSYDGVLLQVALKKGVNKIRLFYYKTDLFIEFLLSVSMLFALCVFIIIQQKKNKIAGII